MISKTEFDEILAKITEHNVRDIMFLSGKSPKYFIGNKIAEHKLEKALTDEDIIEIANILLIKKDVDLETFCSVDVAYQTHAARFRANICKAIGSIRIVMRVIPNEVRVINELNLPEQVRKITRLKSGLVLIGGGTRQGKSTTIAAILEEINLTRSTHIITLENPIEHIYEPKLSIISQCEVADDIKDYKSALRAVLRQSCDIVMVGEIQDAETFEAALIAAETGHLVISSFSAGSIQSILTKILIYYPYEQRQMLFNRLARTLKYIFVQEMLPVINADNENFFVPRFEIFDMQSLVKIVKKEFLAKAFDDIYDYAKENCLFLALKPFDLYTKLLYKKGLIDLDTLKRNTGSSKRVLPA